MRQGLFADRGRLTLTQLTPMSQILVSLTLCLAVFVTSTTHYKSMGVCRNTSHFHDPHWICLIWWGSVSFSEDRNNWLLLIVVRYFVTDPSKGHLRSSEFRKHFSIAFNPIETETQNGCQCVCLTKAHRLSYDMAYPGQKLTLIWRQISRLTCWGN